MSAYGILSEQTAQLSLTVNDRFIQSGEVRLLRGTDWIFKQFTLFFAFNPTNRNVLCKDSLRTAQ
jgi:hypothetical protein